MESQLDGAERAGAKPRNDSATPEYKKIELVKLLVERTVPDKDDILRTKSLIRELAQDSRIAHPAPIDVNGFIAAYLDLYVGRITADPEIERSALRRCLTFLGVAGADDVYGSEHDALDALDARPKERRG